MGRLEPNSKLGKSKSSGPKPVPGSEVRRRAKDRKDVLTLANTIDIIGTKVGNTRQASIDLTSCGDNKYKEIRSIGQGGMKAIHIVKDRDTTRSLAMATLLDNQVNENNIRRFIREARITAALEHPNIVPIHDIGVDSRKRPYFTMKLLEGESLFDILKKLGEGSLRYVKKYNLPARIHIFRKICEAINFAHAKGIIHLDLKPGNIHISHYGEVLVIDWGLAKFLNEDEEFEDSKAYDEIKDQNIENTMAGVIKGSPGYMAPEQAAPKKFPKDERTDIYSLGCILYSMLTWKNPISSNSIDQILKNTVQGKIVPPRERAPERFIPPALEAMALKAMKVEPWERYQSVEELMADLDAYTEGFATSAERIGRISLFWMAIKRRKLFTAMVVLIVLIIAGSFGYIYYNNMVNQDKLKALLLNSTINEKMAKESLEELKSEKLKTIQLGKDAAPKTLQQAIANINAGDYVNALDRAFRAVEQDETLGSAQRIKSWLLMCEGRYIEASLALEQIKEESQEMMEYYFELADACRKNGGFEGSSISPADFVKLVELMFRFPVSENEVATEDLIGHLFSFKNAQEIDVRHKLPAIQYALENLNKGVSVDLQYKFLDEGSQILRLTVTTKDGVLKCLTPLKNLQVQVLDLGNSEMGDLTLLDKFPLDHLVLPKNFQKIEVLTRKIKIIDFSHCKKFDWNLLLKHHPFEEMLYPKKIEEPAVFAELRKMDIKVTRSYL